MAVRFHQQEYPWCLDLFAGGLAGATATVVTHPLDVLQTRLQSSKYGLIRSRIPVKLPIITMNRITTVKFMGSSQPIAPVQNVNLVSYAKSMIKSEGYSWFFRGLTANVVAISMSKGIYFTIYAGCKKRLRQDNGGGYSESTYVHVLSASLSGFVTCTLTNPIWFIKTRLQLDCNDRSKFQLRMPITIYQKEGIRVFYSGLTASYLGILETVLHFALYEYLRRIIKERRIFNEPKSAFSETFHASDFVIAATVSKTIATVLAYPHEVFRTRMREQEAIDKSYSRLIRSIWSKNGWQGFYGGLATHLIRQVPNTVIVFLTYESVVYFGTQLLKIRT